jgi:sporulation protein YlmC with PRC-barrel domain
MHENSTQVLSATTIIGTVVKNPAGDSLGEIEEIMLDRSTGQVAYAVLSFGGFLGMGEKLFAVPWTSMRPNGGDHSFILDVDKKRLEIAPGFDKHAWPNTSDRSFMDSMYEFYQVKPYYAA